MSEIIEIGNLIAKSERRYEFLEERIDGKKIRVQSLTIKELEELDARKYESGTLCTDYVFADTCIATFVDEDGDQIAGEMHREQLSLVDGGLARRIYAQILRHLRAGPHRVSDDELKKTGSKNGSSIGSLTS